MKIVADKNIMALTSWLPKGIDWVLKPGRAICAADLVDADALLVRSITRVDEHLLKGSSIGFVATATSGTDHLDLPWLAANGITVADAAGANANAVAEYVIASLAELMLEENLPLWNLTVAVIGVGHVGSALLTKLTALGIPCVACDPFQQILDGVSYVDLNTALQADVICLHTPLTEQGSYPTYHMLDEHRLKKINPSAIIVNAGRGEVIDNKALLAHLQHCPQQRVILDVWENEPKPSPQLLQRVFIGTPHIAGYSVEAKLASTKAVAAALIKHFALEKLKMPMHSAGAMRVHGQRYEGDSASLLVRKGSDQQMFAGIVSKAFSPKAVSRRFKDIYQATSFSADPGAGAEVFDSIRADLSARREFGATHVHAAGFSSQLSVWLHAAGFVLQA
jgi:erythronate-4-phosphate dehydrogenase